MAETGTWYESQDFEIILSEDGKIIDYLNKNRTLANKPEERVRQKMVHIIHRELGYPTEHIGIECSIKIGGETKRADIVVYNTAEAKESKDQGNIHFIAETKNPSVLEPDGQLYSYISATSAQGGFWTNGNRIEFYRKESTTGKIISWLGTPKYQQAWDSIGKYKKSDLIIPVDLKLAFLQCHNAMYRSGIDSEDVALDMVRIILSKIEDESSAEEDCEFHITPEEIENKKTMTEACTRVRKLFDIVKNRHKDVFSTYEKITASDAQLAVVIAQLQKYNFLESSHDVIGTAYEVYVASHLKGERGQFFTNRFVVDMMVKMASPNEKSVVLDPACGSGGFLLSAMNYVFDRVKSSNRSDESKEILRRNAVHNLFGIDISPKLVKIAKANMLIGKDGHGGIERANSLDNTSTLSERFTDLCGLGKPDIILTNPPFGSGHDLRIKESFILGQYKNGHQWDISEEGLVVYGDVLNNKQGVAPELLFLERCLEWIKEGGVVGIVMAKGQLDNREALGVRKLLCQRARILAVVNLHEDTFQPFCGSKASVIFFRKEKQPPTNYKIFMAVSNKTGQTSRGEAILKKDKEGKPIITNGRHIIDEDLSQIADNYLLFTQAKLEESEYCYTVSFSDLDSNSMSLNPVHYLPRHNEAIKQVLSLDESKFDIQRLGNIARVFNGPRFKRPYAENNVTEGKNIRKYFTGTALTQANSDNIKYLDISRASQQVKKQIDALTIHKGYILISDSGTLGRVTYALSTHNGHVATNNLIRVVIKNFALRGYVYQFLRSELGQSLMLKNAYGTNQEHLEPYVIADIPIPIPKDKKEIANIGHTAIKAIKETERSIKTDKQSQNKLKETLQIP